MSSFAHFQPVCIGHSSLYDEVLVWPLMEFEVYLMLFDICEEMAERVL